MDKVLVTGDVFINSDNITQLEQAGCSVTRSSNSDMTEKELCEALQGFDGYILGGNEKVTKKVIDSAKNLRAIACTGIGFESFVPAWEHALSKNILVTNTPEGPTNGCAEFLVSAALAMNRNLFTFGRVGERNSFAESIGLENQKIGIIGLGHIGQRVAKLVKNFNPSTISYYSRRRSASVEAELGINYQHGSTLLHESDVVFLTVRNTAKNFMDKVRFNQMKSNALLVSVMHPGVIVEADLLDALQSKKIRAISDYPMQDGAFDDLPLDSWYCMNQSHTLTSSSKTLMGDMATDSMLEALATGADLYDIRNMPHVKASAFPAAAYIS